MNHRHPSSGHFILPASLIIRIGLILLVLTGVTVAVAQWHLGWRWNFFLAMIIATLKALLVILYFMGLRFDVPVNRLIFGVSFPILAVFFLLVFSDLFYREEGVYPRKGVPPWAVPSQTGPARFRTPWVSTPELVAHGQKIFEVNCTSCHGPQGKGDGPAAAALNPHPRNFHEGGGWKNGRKPTQVYKTLKEGIAGSSMASYSNLPADDVWGAVHYVLSFLPPETDTAADLQKAGLGEGGGAVQAEEKHLPIEFIMQRMEEEVLQEGA